MTWKAIGQSATGTSHTSAGKPCEDAINYRLVAGVNGNEALISCISDGAGSARYAAFASAFCTASAVEHLSELAMRDVAIREEDIFRMAEDIYDGLVAASEETGELLNEYSCTMLGCYITTDRAIFFQVGDGVIVRNVDDLYNYVWWPDNGEYQNTTSFLIDDKNLSNLNILILEEQVNEVAMLTDGLQLLALTTETRQVHQPFFTGLFRYLRLASDAEKIAILDTKLAEYLNGDAINSRTDDDKTLFLATRIAK